MRTRVNPSESGNFALIMKAGLTLLELMLVLALILGVAALSLPLLSKWFSGGNLTLSSEQLRQALNWSRQAGSAYYRGQPHGIKLTANGYTLFTGASFSARQVALDRDVDLERGVSLSWQLSGSGQGDEIVFSSLGTPSRSGVLTLTALPEIQTLNLNQWGAIY